MKSVMEIQKELQNAFYVAFTCGEKDGYIDCCYSDELKKIRDTMKNGGHGILCEKCSCAVSINSSRSNIEEPSSRINKFKTTLTSKINELFKY